MPQVRNDAPIGVFDSGLGGLTVLRAIAEQLPHEDLVYLGDSARVPYGTRSAQTVANYARACAHKLSEQLGVIATPGIVLSGGYPRAAIAASPCTGI